MTGTPDSSSTDTISRVILASPRALYRAHLDPEMMANWRTPEGMRTEILMFEGHLGGRYRLALHPNDQKRGGVESDASRSDLLTGLFEELVPDETIVEHLRFGAEDALSTTSIILTTTLRAVRDGTKITIACSPCSPAESKRASLAWLATALRNLAMLTE